MFAGNFAPVGWAFCNGQLMSIAENDALFSLIGTTYGGDGQETFAMPDLRGRTPIHQGSGAGLSTRVLGQMIGSETVALINATMPAHYHTIHAVSTAGSQGVPTGATFAASSTGEKQYTQNTPGTTMSPTSISFAGSGVPHENMAPFQAVSFIICLEGIYPPQN
jgi:microcystin-dependent protein